MDKYGQKQKYATRRSRRRAKKKAIAELGGGDVVSVRTGFPKPSRLSRNPNRSDWFLDQSADGFLENQFREDWFRSRNAVRPLFLGGADWIEIDKPFLPEFDLIASTVTHSHDSTWRKRDQKKAGDLESRFLTSSYFCYILQ
nr:hypothetical protein Iba_chr05aCG9140 [Ipomoea batatas]